MIWLLLIPAIYVVGFFITMAITVVSRNGFKDSFGIPNRADFFCTIFLGLIWPLILASFIEPYFDRFKG